MDRRDDYRLLAAALAGHRLPDVAECETMFDAAATPEATRRHGRAVAALATSLARRLQAAGEAIDPDLARAAALVHDIAKGRRRHAEAGAALLREFGFPELAAPVARHMNLAFDAGRLDETRGRLPRRQARPGRDPRFAGDALRAGARPFRRRPVGAGGRAATARQRPGDLRGHRGAHRVRSRSMTAPRLPSRREEAHGLLRSPSESRRHARASARPVSRRSPRSASPKATSSICARPARSTARSSRRSGAASIPICAGAWRRAPIRARRAPLRRSSAAARTTAASVPIIASRAVACCWR